MTYLNDFCFREILCFMIFDPKKNTTPLSIPTTCVYWKYFVFEIYLGWVLYSQGGGYHNFVLFKELVKNLRARSGLKETSTVKTNCRKKYWKYCLNWTENIVKQKYISAQKIEYEHQPFCEWNIPRAAILQLWPHMVATVFRKQ